MKKLLVILVVLLALIGAGTSLRTGATPQDDRTSTSRVLTLGLYDDKIYYKRKVIGFEELAAIIASVQPGEIHLYIDEPSITSNFYKQVETFSKSYREQISWVESLRTDKYVLHNFT